jgi:branched-chain amino acid aminotransferase
MASQTQTILPHNSSKTRGTVISINGKFVPFDQATVSVLDRSFLYGDSLYEVVRTYRGKPFRLKEHLKRLEKSAALCQMTFTQPISEYETAMLEAIDRYRSQPGKTNEDVYVRLIVSRGAGKIGFGKGNVETPTLYVVIVEPASLFPNKPFEVGTRLQISGRTRNLPNSIDPAMKSGNYLNSLLAYLTAAQSGYDDALLLDYQGFMTEGTTFNIFYVHRGIVATPPLDVGILDGITRRAILDLCVAEGIPCREVRFPKEYLYQADEVFVSSSLKEVLPVLELDGKKIGNGKPGPISKQLKLALDELIRKECQV